jgi:hypothetical protein
LKPKTQQRLQQPLTRGTPRKETAVPNPKLAEEISTRAAQTLDLVRRDLAALEALARDEGWSGAEGSTRFTLAQAFFHLTRLEAKVEEVRLDLTPAPDV